MGRDLLSIEIKAKKPSKLLPLVIRGFGGGLNTVENDILMSPSDQVALNNMRRTASGGQKVRYGSNWFEDVSDTVTGTIVDMEYFANTIISVTTTGQICATDNDGVSIVIWNSAIAALLPGAPSGWSAGITNVDFVPFRNQLIVHNGIDKPITISASLVVTYLQDLGSGSNTNTPIGKYGCVVSNYHCIAGISGLPNTIYISAKGTAGTFFGDPAPNDSISIDVGAYAPEGAAEIRGIAGFRTFLIVFFLAQSLVVQLGIYNDATTPEHVPEFPDSMPDFGILGHRCIKQVENDMLFAGLDGLASATRNLFGNLDTLALSEKIEPFYRATIAVLTDTQIRLNCFLVYDSLAHDLILSIPSGPSFVYSFNDRLRYRSWSTFSGQGMTAACTSFLGRVFYSIGTRIFQYGNGAYLGENYAADRLNDRDGDWAPVTAYAVGDILRDVPNDSSWIAIGNNVSGSVSFAQDRADQVLAPKWTEYEGEAIAFEMELPWLDSKDPTQTKILRFASVGSKGTGEFMLKIYVDNLFKDGDGVIQYNPAVTVNFIGNDAPGFGFDAGPYGGGRRSDDPRLWNVPVKFKTLKCIYAGSVRKPLELISQKFVYARGSRQR